MNKLSKSLRLPVLAVAVAVAGAALPAAAGDVFVFYSLADRDILESVESAFEVHDAERYKVDLLALADYSAKQKVIARANRRAISVVIGPQAGRVLAGTALANPVVAFEVRDTLTSGSEIVIYVFQGRAPADLIVLPRKIATVEDVERLTLQTVAAFRLDERAEPAAILAAVIGKMAAQGARAH